MDLFLNEEMATPFLRLISLGFISRNAMPKTFRDRRFLCYCGKGRALANRGFHKKLKNSYANALPLQCLFL